MPKIPLIGTEALGYSSDVNARRAVNWMPFVDFEGGKEKIVWINAPGTKAWGVDSPAGLVIGGFTVFRDGATQEMYYGAADTPRTLRKMDTDGNESASLGTIILGSNPRITSNLSQIIYVSGVGFANALYVLDKKYNDVFVNANKFCLEATVTAIQQVSAVNITSIVHTGNTATVTATAHLGYTGDYVTIAGTASHDGAQGPITRIGANSYSYDHGSNPGDEGVVGTTVAHRYTCTATAHGGANGEACRISGSTNFDFEYNASPDSGIQDVAADAFTIGGQDLSDDPDDETSISATVYIRNAAISTDFPVLTDVTILDDYAVYLVDPTSDPAYIHNRFYVSVAEDASIILPASYASADGEGDEARRVYAFQDNLYIFTEWATKVWYNAGLTPQPFAPARQAAIPLGIAAKESLAELGAKYLCLLGQTKQGGVGVYVMDSYDPQDMTGGALAEHLRGCTLAQIEAAYAIGFTILNRDIYALTVNGRTFCLNVTDSKKAGTPLWWEWNNTQDDAGMRFSFYAYFNGRHLVSQAGGAYINEIDLDTYTTLWGTTADPMARTGVSGYIHADDKGLIHNRLRVDVASNETGGTLALEYSDDKGHNWTQAGSKTWTGFSNRLEWHTDELGGYAETDRLYRLSTSSASKLLILGGYVDVEPCLW